MYYRRKFATFGPKVYEMKYAGLVRWPVWDPSFECNKKWKNWKIGFLVREFGRSTQDESGRTQLCNGFTGKIYYNTLK